MTICANCAHAREEHGSLACWGDTDCTCSLAQFAPSPTPRNPLPYGGTAGHSGSETSRDRAETDAEDGTAHARQAIVLALLAQEGEAGITVVDLRRITGWHHGQASGVLSGLHKTGAIIRLSGRQYRRDRCEPYILDKYAAERTTAEHGSKRITITTAEAKALVTYLGASGYRPEAGSPEWEAMAALGQRLQHLHL